MTSTPLPTGTVYIVDDTEAVGDSIRWLVEEVGHSAKTFLTAQDFLNENITNICGCLVLDVRMPGMSGLDLQDVLRERGVSLPVIIITGHGDVPMAVRSMKAGAFEFFQKPFNDQDLLDCIYSAIGHHQSLLEEKNLSVEATRNLSSLTKRELEILNLLRAGDSSKLIAKKLHISVRTVEGHRANIMNKMRANSVAQLIKIAHLASTLPS